LLKTRRLQIKMPMSTTLLMTICLYIYVGKPVENIIKRKIKQ